MLSDVTGLKPGLFFCKNYVFKGFFFWWSHTPSYIMRYHLMHAEITVWQYTLIRLLLIWGKICVVLWNVRIKSTAVIRRHIKLLTCNQTFWQLWEFLSNCCKNGPLLHFFQVFSRTVVTNVNILKLCYFYTVFTLKH